MRLPRLTLKFRFGRRPRDRFRLIPKADARPVALFRADARRAAEGPATRGAAAPGEGRRLGRRTLAIALSVVFLAAVATAVLGSRGVRDVLRNESELREAETKLGAQQELVADLRREVQRLKEDRLAVERIARESLGFVRPGEITFLLPDGGPAARGALGSRGAEAGPGK